jgi:hypothetical protein
MRALLSLVSSNSSEKRAIGVVGPIRVPRIRPSIHIYPCVSAEGHRVSQLGYTPSQDFRHFQEAMFRKALDRTSGSKRADRSSSQALTRLAFSKQKVADLQHLGQKNLRIGGTGISDKESSSLADVYVHVCMHGMHVHGCMCMMGWVRMYVCVRMDVCA